MTTIIKKNLSKIQNPHETITLNVNGIQTKKSVPCFLIDMDDYHTLSVLMKNENFDININLPKQHKKNLLLYAIKQGKMSIVKLFLKSPKLILPPKMIFFACKNQQFDIAKELMNFVDLVFKQDAAKKQEFYFYNDGFRNIFAFALIYQNYEFLKQLLKKFTCKQWISTNNDFVNHLQACFQSQNFPMLKLLAKHKFFKYQTHDYDVLRMFEFALKSHNLKIVELFLDQYSIKKNKLLFGKFLHSDYLNETFFEKVLDVFQEKKLVESFILFFYDLCRNIDQRASVVTKIVEQNKKDQSLETMCLDAMLVVELFTIDKDLRKQRFEIVANIFYSNPDIDFQKVFDKFIFHGLAATSLLDQFFILKDVYGRKIDFNVRYASHKSVCEKMSVLNDKADSLMATYDEKIYELVLDRIENQKISQVPIDIDIFQPVYIFDNVENKYEAVTPLSRAFGITKLYDRLLEWGCYKIIHFQWDCKRILFLPFYAQANQNVSEKDCPIKMLPIEILKYIISFCDIRYVDDQDGKDQLLGLTKEQLTEKKQKDKEKELERKRKEKEQQEQQEKQNNIDWYLFFQSKKQKIDI